MDQADCNSQLPRYEHIKVGPAPSSMQLCTMESFYSVYVRDYGAKSEDPSIRCPMYLSH